MYLLDVITAIRKHHLRVVAYDLEGLGRLRWTRKLSQKIYTFLSLKKETGIRFLSLSLFLIQLNQS
jgi:hypothetical protein